MVLLGVFVVSPLIVVAALWAVAAINTWWALIGALGVYAATTVAVFTTVAFVLSGHLPRDHRRREPTARKCTPGPIDGGGPPADT
jgi:hypothetical protein